MKKGIEITTPITNEHISALNTGDVVYITGVIYTARDAAHKRLLEMIKNNEEMPFEFHGQVVFYAGPSPTKHGNIIGSIGPTTSGRMDLYSPTIIKNGLKAMIGKGLRNDEVVKTIVEEKGIYFVAIGGSAALMSKCVKKVEIIAFEDLGTEAIRKLYVERLPVIVAIDCKGNSIYTV